MGDLPAGSVILQERYPIICIVLNSFIWRVVVFFAIFVIY